MIFLVNWYELDWSQGFNFSSPQCYGKQEVLKPKQLLQIKFNSKTISLKKFYEIFQFVCDTNLSMILAIEPLIFSSAFNTLSTHCKFSSLIACISIVLFWFFLLFLLTYLFLIRIPVILTIRNIFYGFPIVFWRRKLLQLTVNMSIRFIFVEKYFKL